jgi:DNA-binding HxlR family transcriptional regulator
VVSKLDGTQFIQISLGLLDGKWKILIPWNIHQQPQHLSELKWLISVISEKVLIQ